MPLRKPLSTPVTVKGTFPDSTFHIGASLPIHLKAEAWISADKAIAASNMLRRNSVCRKHRLKATRRSIAIYQRDSDNSFMDGCRVIGG